PLSLAAASAPAPYPFPTRRSSDLTQLAEFAVPRFMLWPTWTLPSLVPAMTTVADLVACASWLMKERSPSVPLVRFGLFGYQLSRGMPPARVSHTRVVPPSM